jgi:hypothetical protein
MNRSSALVTSARSCRAAATCAAFTRASSSCSVPRVSRGWLAPQPPSATAADNSAAAIPYRPWPLPGRPMSGIYPQRRLRASLGWVVGGVGVGCGRHWRGLWAALAWAVGVTGVGRGRHGRRRSAGVGSVRCAVYAPGGVDAAERLCGGRLAPAVAFLHCRCMGILRGIDGSTGRGPGAGEPPLILSEERRAIRSTRLCSGTLACPGCDAPICIGSDELALTAIVRCPYCRRGGPLRDFLTLRRPTRPARVAVCVRLPALSG